MSTLAWEYLGGGAAGSSRLDPLCWEPSTLADDCMSAVDRSHMATGNLGLSLHPDRYAAAQEAGCRLLRPAPHALVLIPVLLSHSTVPNCCGKLDEIQR